MNAAAGLIAEAPSADTRRVGVVRASALFAGRSIRHSLRDGEGLVMAIALPVMLMLLFTVVFGGAIMGDDYLTYVVPGTILLAAGFGASSVAVGVAADVSRGAIDRFRTLPIPAFTVVLGHVVASVARNALATTVVVGVALALGFRPTADPIDVLAATAIVLGYLAAITLLFAFIGLVAGSPESAGASGFALLFLPYVSSAFVPLATLPAWLRPFAEHQPVTPIVESVRGLLTGGATDAWPAATAWILAIAMVGAVLVAWRFPRVGR